VDQAVLPNKAFIDIPQEWKHTLFQGTGFELGAFARECSLESVTSTTFFLNTSKVMQSTSIW